MSSRSFEFDASEFFRHIDLTEEAVQEALSDGMEDVTDDLGRISQGIAPILTGDLRQSVNTNVAITNRNIEGTVAFSAINNGFNYAPWTHEMTYNLGPVSAMSAGTDGYTVGNKYLERPLKGEMRKYIRWLANNASNAMD